MKLPFYYNVNLLNSFIFLKISNYCYYAKLLFIDMRDIDENMDTLMRKKLRDLYFLERVILPRHNKKQKKAERKLDKRLAKKFKNLVKYRRYLEPFPIFSYAFDSFDDIGYINMDFLQTSNPDIYANAQKPKQSWFFRKAYPLGYTYSYQSKCFFPQKAQTIDIFEEKEIILQNPVSYLSNLKNSFTFLFSDNAVYKTLVPFKLLRGGYLALGLGASGFVPSSQLLYFNFNYFSFKYLVQFRSSCFTRIFLGCCPFFASQLTMRFFSPNTSLRAKSRSFFFNYSIVFLTHGLSCHSSGLFLHEILDENHDFSWLYTETDSDFEPEIVKKSVKGPIATIEAPFQLPQVFLNQVKEQQQLRELQKEKDFQEKRAKQKAKKEQKKKEKQKNKE